MATKTVGRSITTRPMQMTARYYAQAVAELLARPNLEPEERDRLIDEIRQLAQFAADHDALPTITKSDPAKCAGCGSADLDHDSARGRDGQAIPTCRTCGAQQGINVESETA